MVKVSILGFDVILGCSAMTFLRSPVSQRTSVFLFFWRWVRVPMTLCLALNLIFNEVRVGGNAWTGHGGWSTDAT
jgi:hypothetical protein